MTEWINYSVDFLSKIAVFLTSPPVISVLVVCLFIVVSRIISMILR